MVEGACASLFQIHYETVNTSSEIQKGKGPLSFRLLKRKPLHALQPRLNIKVGSLRPTLLLLKFWWETLRSWISVIDERPWPHHPHPMGGEERVTGAYNLLLFFSISPWFLFMAPSSYKQEPLWEMGISASPNQCNQG